MDIKLETALRKLKINTEDIHEWERVYELAAKSNKAIQLTWQDGTTQIVRDVYTSTQRLGLVLSLQRWNIPLDPTYRGLYPVEIRGLKNISFVDKPGYIDDSMSHTVREHAVVKIRALLESTDTQINRLLTSLRANPADEDLLVNLYHVAKRAGKSVTFSPQKRLHLNFKIVDITDSIPAGHYSPVPSLNSPPTAEGRVGFALSVYSRVTNLPYSNPPYWYVMDEIVHMKPRYEVI
jgi:hypothetical protein